LYSLYIEPLNISFALGQNKKENKVDINVDSSDKREFFNFLQKN
jgi:hypothetical protein